MAPQYFEFFCPTKILSGKNALENVPFEVERLGGHRPLVVTDKGVSGAGLVELLRTVFAGTVVEIGAVFDGTPPDSSMATVTEIAALFSDTGCDSLIAIGGGSPIDTAKGVNVVVSEGATDLRPLMGADVIKSSLFPLIVIPTTAGTGSEVTSAAVIADTDRDVKMVLASDKLMPNVAVLDPRTTESLPARITAATGMDALAHSVEAYTCIQKNPVSDAFATKAIELISAHLLACVRDGGNVDARMGMANAALLAGAAFSNSMVGGVHALGHATGGVAHVAHGNAMAIFLPIVMEHNLEKVGHLYGELLLPLRGANVYARTPAGKRPQACIDAVRGLNAEMTPCGHPVSLRECGVKREDFEGIAQRAIDDGASLLNPRNLIFDDAMSLLEKAY